MSKVEINEVHALEIYRDQMRKELATAVEWRENWGFLAEQPPPPPRGFTQASVKYSSGSGAWTNAKKRVTDNTAEGMAAAISEQNSRTTLSKLSWESKAISDVKPCVAKQRDGREINCVDDELSGVKNRTAAKMMLAGHFQTLGDACRIDGLDPREKYVAPLTSAQEIGWRAPSKSNPRPSLELFGVCQHGRKDKIKTLFDMVP